MADRTANARKGRTDRRGRVGRRQTTDDRRALQPGRKHEKPPELRFRGLWKGICRGLSQHRFQYAEQHERDEERNDDIESLGGEERPQEIAVLPGNDILEARIEPHADEGQREEYRREHFGDTRLGKFTLGIGREEAVALQKG